MDASVRVVRPEDRDSGTAQSAGIQRFAGVSAALTGAEHLWMGYAVLPAGGRTAVHHHGDSETAIFVISGVGRWWIGDRLDEKQEARAGDFVFVPPGVVHWEENASETEPVEMIVARSTQEAIVVNIEDHPYAPTRGR